MMIIMFMMMMMIMMIRMTMMMMMVMMMMMMIMNVIALCLQLPRNLRQERISQKHFGSRFLGVSFIKCFSLPSQKSKGNIPEEK